jgi:hypothetical protein
VRSLEPPHAVSSIGVGDRKFAADRIRVVGLDDEFVWRLAGWSHNGARITPTQHLRTVGLWPTDSSVGGLARVLVAACWSACWICSSCLARLASAQSWPHFLRRWTCPIGRNWHLRSHDLAAEDCEWRAILFRPAIPVFCGNHDGRAGDPRHIVGNSLTDVLAGKKTLVPTSRSMRVRWRPSYAFRV